MDSNESHILTTEYGVVKSILSGLPTLQLNKAATVCKAWNETARVIKRSRHQIYTTADQNSYENPSQVDELINVMKSQPCLCLTFLTNHGQGEEPPLTTFPCEPNMPRFGRCTEYRIVHRLRQRLPSNCLIAGAVTPGVVVCDGSLKTVEVEDGKAFGLIMIPEMPELVLNNFYLDKVKLKKVAAALTSQPESVGQHLGIKDSDDLKCLILIGTDPCKESKIIEALCAHISAKNPSVAIGGGFVDAIIHPDIADRERNYGVMGLTYSGPNVQASSMVITQDANQAEDVEKALIQMKKNHQSLSQRRSLAFMFACVARGVHLHGQTGVESSLFRKHFPTTPLMGFFGNGEIGLDSPASTTTTTKAKKSRPSHLYSYATTFVLVSFSS